MTCALGGEDKLYGLRLYGKRCKPRHIPRYRLQRAGVNFVKNNCHVANRDGRVKRRRERELFVERPTSQETKKKNESMILGKRRGERNTVL